MTGYRRPFGFLAACLLFLAAIGIAWGTPMWQQYGCLATPWKEGAPMGPGMQWGMGMWIFPLVGLVVFLVLIYIVATRVFGEGGPGCGWGRRRGGPSGERTPVDILKTRYAKGEVSREEFERMKKDLTE